MFEPRKLLKAIRRCGSSVAQPQKLQSQTQEQPNVSARRNTTVTKNIACDRMNKLRENLAKELEAKNTTTSPFSFEFGPQAKRFRTSESNNNSSTNLFASPQPSTISPQASIWKPQTNTSKCQTNTSKPQTSTSNPQAKNLNLNTQANIFKTPTKVNVHSWPKQSTPILSQNQVNAAQKSFQNQSVPSSSPSRKKKKKKNKHHPSYPIITPPPKTPTEESPQKQTEAQKQKSPSALQQRLISAASSPSKANRPLSSSFIEDASFGEYNSFAQENSSLFTQANNSDQNIDEDMDWTPGDEENLLSDIRIAREILHEQCISSEPSLICRPEISSSAIINNPMVLKPSNAHVYVVVDTNIFIDKLQTVVNIMSISYQDKTFPIVYAPWMVIQELDYFKDGYSLSDKHPISKMIQAKCRKAVKFINDCLSASMPNFKGQSVLRAAEDRLKSQNPDDSIITCCVQLANEGFDVILLSSDVNLRNKSIISSIPAYSPLEIMQILRSRKVFCEKQGIANEVTKKMSLIYSFMVHCELKNYLGDRLYALKGFKELPWSLQDCVNYVRENYEAVFQSHLQKHCRKVVDDLYEILKSNDISNEMRFVELCLSMLIYFQNGFPKYDANIQNVIREIMDLENK